MAGASAEGEVNHWPAFVDVLTTVIMVVTFLLVIMSAAVMVLSQRVMEKFRQQIVAQQQLKTEQAKNHTDKSASGGAQGQSRNAIRSPADAETGSSIAELGSILKSEPIDGSDRLTIRTRETPDTLKLQVKAMEEPKESQGVAVTAADVLLRVDFEPTAVRYSDDNRKQVVSFLRSRQQPGMKYEIWSFAPQVSSISEAQRLAFFRAAMTRNILIDAGIAPGAINTQIRVTDPMSRDGHNVRVVLKP
jgi:regulatory protein YycI of two-component signal transduction system YycFG